MEIGFLDIINVVDIQLRGVYNLKVKILYIFKDDYFYSIIEEYESIIEEFKKQRNIEIVSESVAHIDYNIDTKVKHGNFIAIPLK